MDCHDLQASLAMTEEKEQSEEQEAKSNRHCEGVKQPKLSINIKNKQNKIKQKQE